MTPSLNNDWVTSISKLVLDLVKHAKEHRDDPTEQIFVASMLKEIYKKFDGIKKWEVMANPEGQEAVRLWQELIKKEIEDL